MNNRLAVFARNVFVAFCLVLPASGYAATGGLAQTPLFISPGTQHNVMFVMDDSRLMDLELLLNGAPSGAADDETLTTWFGQLLGDSGVDVLNLSELLIGSANYGYLFETFLAPESGGVRRYNGQRLNEDHQVVPPMKAFGFMRSNTYNPQYYDPAVDYAPWSQDGVYGDAVLGNPLLDPNYPMTFDEATTTAGGALISGVTDLIDSAFCAFFDSPLNIFGLPKPDYCKETYPLAETRILPFAFSGSLAQQLKIATETGASVNRIISESADGSLSLADATEMGLGCTAEQLSANFQDLAEDLVQDVYYQCIAFTPATYYVPVNNGSYKLWFLPETFNCASPNPEHFASLVQQWSLENSLTFKRADGTAFDGALAPDGRCLERIRVNDESRVYHAGTDYERTFVEELQNFSNWFQYHRSRHQSVRYGLGESLQSISGIRADLLTVNDQTTDASMLDTSDRAVDGDFEALQEKVFHAYDDVPATNEAPLRGALDYVGTQYQRTGVDAPIQYECQRNYTLMYTDGFATDYEVDSSSLADIAAEYYSTNLRTDLPQGQVRIPGQCLDNDPYPGLDCNSNLHMNTYGVLLGSKGTVYGQQIDGTLYDSVDDVYAVEPAWPDVNDVTDPAISMFQIDDLYRATVNGKGEIYNARLPADITDGLNRALEDIDNQSGAAAAVTFSSATVESDSLIFSAIFNSRRWSGQLSARALNSSNGRLVKNADGSYIGDVVWEAGAILDSRNLNANAREIITYNSVTGQGVPFQWSSLTTTQRADLLTATDSLDATAAENLAIDRLAYIRGNRGKEAPFGQFRVRDGRLGDIVHSAPVYVAEPRMGWPDQFPYGAEGARYSDFRYSDTISGRTPVVYVGANDGMLHAFKATRDATGGDELFAYVPDLVFSDSPGKGLNYLTDPGYLHRYYVDLTPTVFDAYIDVDDGTGDGWRSLLIGGLRAGGRGLFALDITSPDSVGEADADDLALWEFVNDDLGYVIEPVNVILTDLGSGYEWVAVFGNGLDAPSGRTGLFLLRLEGGLDGTWTENSDYWFIEVDSGPAGGMNSDVRLIDLDADNLVDRIYTSDLDGRIWAFAYDANNDEWASAYNGNGADAGPKPLFTAPAGQPITSAPMVVRNPFVETGNQTAPNLLVLFGTGQYLNQGDVVNTTPTQSFYGIWDSGVSDLDTEGGLLLERDITESTTDEGVVRNLSDDEITWGDKNTPYMGWYIDFDTLSGERVIMVPQVRGNTILFNTTIPPTNECSSNGGSFRMFVDLDGTDPDQQVFDTNGDGRVTNADTLVSGFYFAGGVLSMSRILGKVMFDNTAGGVGELQDFTNENVVEFGDKTLSGRLGWRELISD
ncbi:Tfp pilus assembly protein, tip-associated adhesin PilY1 [Marinobacter lipolyticus SM19]|uniref:Tfp pilus assembly protein, tip-associated adhesin PilY1 n=1 Tax=Marinobacter lipolyticus SM19 TaxID=1318628 RepID=R8AWI0_9GAMM|nr:PilC/PilY family type IV pilus protein [Marinobacter lipolyticus]EON90691.1 Tfp pilus assembly protein, tip-associated adhesin PilY1 [Marinobacter lipolyticus SM19]